MANRWDRDRFAYERERDRFDDRPPPPGRFEDRPPPPRFDDRDDAYSQAPPPRRPREHSDERYDRYPPARPPPGRGFDDDHRRYYGDDDRLPPRRDERDVERRLYIDRERERYASPSPPRRPTMVRRQSSLDTFDRRPLHFLDREPREEYGQMTRREDFRREREREEFRAPPYQPIPLPRTRQLGPARPAPYDDISVAEPGYYVVYDRTVIRDVSPTRSVYSSAYTDSGAPLYHEHREMSSEIPVGPMALVTRHRSQSRSQREIRAEIKALEAEMRETRISKRHEHRHDRDREIVRAERMPDGALVLFEEKVENVEHGHRPARIEKDKKGRMAISIPKKYL
ncbi:hypothetical protein BN1723_016344 [Verticillium longisporum]|uniref:Uncharacterized protein n=1 Tax=Verticillium longisporum TaxID=100787 RepID=A0A0G4NDF5_VERLO|nr:hypothetical protein BN1723_016344 [Verticillium longisporum]